jgi:hypothetical protein
MPVAPIVGKVRTPTALPDVLHFGAIVLVGRSLLDKQ